MNVKLKRCLEFLVLAAITFVVALSSPLNPFMSNAFTAVQQDILDIAYSVREGYLAYVELGGHYGPVLYEFYGLGYLPTDTHFVQFIMECIILFFSVLFLYKTAKLYTSNFFAVISTAFLSILGWGAFTHAGAEEFLFFLMSLSCYHIARQLKSGMLSHHAYLLAIDMALVFFLQPGYIWFWVIVIVFFGVKYKIEDIDEKAYRSYWVSVVEGILTVLVPMGIYLIYFKNAAAFWKQVVVYNMSIIGSFGEGLKILIGTPWAITILVLVAVIIIKVLMGKPALDLVYWGCIIVVALVVISVQGENLSSYLQLLKALYIVPIASAFSLLDKALGLKIEERQ
jgi:hypothetical protein